MAETSTYAVRGRSPTACAAIVARWALIGQARIMTANVIGFGLSSAERPPTPLLNCVSTGDVKI